MANFLKSCEKALREWTAAYGKIVGVDAKKKAREGLSEAFWAHVGTVAVKPDALISVTTPGTVVSQWVASDAPEASVSVSATVGGESVPVEISPVEAKETGDAVIPLSKWAGGLLKQSSEATTFMDEGEAGPGVMAEELEKPVVSGGEVRAIDGWPTTAVVKVVGLAPNRRMLKGMIGPRFVSVDKIPGWAVGEYPCRLVRCGMNPLYRVMTGDIR